MKPSEIIKKKKVNTPRAMPDELFEIILKKALQIAGDKLELAYLTCDPLTIAGIAGDALVALNIREKTNNNDGKLVELIQKVAGGKKGYAWCMYFEQARIAFAEQLTGVTSAYPKTGSCASARARMPKSMIIKKENLVYGDNCIKKYKSTGLGHTGMFRNWVKKHSVANLCEGNTTQGKSGDKVIREGGGSYLTERDFDSEWIMFARPFPLLNEIEIPKAPAKAIKVKADWDNEAWTQFVLDALEKHRQDLLKFDNPKDAETFGYKAKTIAEKKAFYLMLISSMARCESSFKPETSYKESFNDSKGKPVISRGLLQISIESGRGYNKSLKKAEELHDPKINLETGVMILNRWIPKDGYIGTNKKGGGRYWSVLRETSSSRAKIIAKMKGHG